MTQRFSRIYRLFLRLRRRQVLSAAAVYIIGVWLILQVASVMFPGFGIPDRAIGYLVQAALIIFPLAMIFAWRYDLTPRGLFRTPSRIDGASADKSLKKTDYLLLVMLLGISFAVVYFSYKEAAEVTESDSVLFGDVDIPENSVAILPFVNRGGNPEDDYLGAGLAEDLLGVLARNTDLHVAARTSSFAFQEKNLPIAEIARQLRVRAILEGSFAKQEGDVRISVQLIDTADGYELWSQSFTRRLDQLQIVKREILTGVARAMGAHIGIDDLSSLVATIPMTEVGAAYQYYLQGKYYWNLRGEDNIRRSVELFKKAIELDAGFARAYSALAVAFVTLPEYSNDPIISAYQLAQDAAQEALRLDGSIGEAYAVIAVINHWNWDWVSAESEFRRAVEVEPTDYTSWMWYSELLVELGRLDEAEEMLLKAIGVDPVSPPVNYLLSWLYLARNYNSEAMKFAQLSIDYGYPYGHLIQSLVHLREGEIDAAIESRVRFSESLDVDAGLGTDVIEAIINPNLIPTVTDRIETMMEQGDFGSTTVIFNYFALQTDHILMGQNDRLFELLEGLIDQHFVRVRVLWLPEAYEARQDPRLWVLSHKIGLADAWRVNGPPDVCRFENGTILCE